MSKKLASETVIPSVNSIVGWCLFFFSNGVVDDISVGVQERDYVSDVVFPKERFGSTFIEDLRLVFNHEDVRKSYCLFW